jgi:hypothetical protein
MECCVAGCMPVYVTVLYVTRRRVGHSAGCTAVLTHHVIHGYDYAPCLKREAATAAANPHLDSLSPRKNFTIYISSFVWAV